MLTCSELQKCIVLVFIGYPRLTSRKPCKIQKDRKRLLAQAAVSLSLPVEFSLLPGSFHPLLCHCWSRDPEAYSSVWKVHSVFSFVSGTFFFSWHVTMNKFYVSLLCPMCLFFRHITCDISDKIYLHRKSKQLPESAAGSPSWLGRGLVRHPGAALKAAQSPVSSGTPLLCQCSLPSVPQSPNTLFKSCSSILLPGCHYFLERADGDLGSNDG